MDYEKILPPLLQQWRRDGTRHWLRVSGQSMLPTMGDGDRVLVTHDLSDVRRGDVIVYREGAGLVAHRIVSIKGIAGYRSFLTKGDNVSHLDPRINEADVVGRVLAVSGYRGVVRVDTPVRRLAGWLLAFATVLIAWACAGMRRAKRSCIGTRPFPGVKLLQQAANTMARAWLLATHRLPERE